MLRYALVASGLSTLLSLVITAAAHRHHFVHSFGLMALVMAFFLGALAGLGGMNDNEGGGFLSAGGVRLGSFSLPAFGITDLPDVDPNEWLFVAGILEGGLAALLLVLF